MQPARAALYLHTLANLRPVQVGNRLVRRLRRRPDVTGPTPPLRGLTAPTVPPVAKPDSMEAPDRFRFLNVARDISGATSWNRPDIERLWTYNLHYFDDLGATGAEQRCDAHIALIARWIAENPPMSGAGWEPYPISLRAVNWIKWHIRHGGLDDAALASLAAQGRALAAQLEYHLLGNHLFANAKALVFLGAFFAGAEAETWLKRGLRILARELPEQILADGGHFERSPMYQAIIAEDLLDLLWLAQAAPDGLRARLPVSDWAEAAERMLAWLGIMTHPDGEIAFFNDATFGIAPILAELACYAEGLGLAAGVPAAHTGIHALADSGYFRLHNDDAVLLFDAGPLGPRYLMGHGHADTLSFEMSLSGRRLFVNGGTSTYRADPQRMRERGSTAHNTVIVDGRDSSEVWSAFRVARAARIVDRRWNVSAGTVTMAAAHDGFHRQFGGPLHRREITLEPGALRVADHLAGGPWREAEARFHLAPDATVEVDNSGRGGRIALGGTILHWALEGGTAAVETGAWHPGFNLSVPCPVLAARFDQSALTLTFRWR
jgi:uncharacterized heparinase superfamily protein